MPLIDDFKKKAVGHVLVRDGVTGEVLADQMNAIHYEHFSEAIGLALANRSTGSIHEMVFGNGASVVSGTGAITYFPPSVTGADARLYNQTYRKVVNDQSPLNLDATRNKISVNHNPGTAYSDIVITCFLDYTEPSGQDFYDDSSSAETNFVFDEIGLKTFSPVVGAGKLICHVIFHPVQKAMNRTIEVIYTIRIYMN